MAERKIMSVEMNKTGQESWEQQVSETVGLVYGLDRPGIHEAWVYAAIFEANSGEDEEKFFMFCWHEAESLTPEERERVFQDYCDRLLGKLYVLGEVGQVRIRLYRPKENVSRVQIHERAVSSAEAAAQAKALLVKDARYSFD